VGVGGGGGGEDMNGALPFGLCRIYGNDSLWATALSI